MCAIGPDGAISIDLVRSTVAAAQWAASCIIGTAWPALASLGWRVLPVRVEVSDPANASDLAEPSRVRRPRNLLPAVVVDAGVLPAHAARPPPSARKMRVVRFGQADAA